MALQAYVDGYTHNLRPPEWTRGSPMQAVCFIAAGEVSIPPTGGVLS